MTVTPALVDGPGISLAEQAYRVLEEMLVTMELPPGQVLQEKDLAQKTGIGRTPVREAIQRLASYGLIRVLPRKGLMIAPVSRQELAKIIETRRVLERLLVVKAAERATEEQRKSLNSLAVQLEHSGNGSNLFLKLDRQLDEMLESACDNAFLAQAMAPLHAHCRRLWYLHHDQQDMAQAAERHFYLTKAVAAGDGSGAIRALNGIIANLEELVGGIDAIS